MPPDLVRRVESVLGAPFSITFAQTEASPCITRTHLDDAPDDRASTLGRPHPHVQVMIADPATGQQVPAGTIGEILTRGYHVMREYFDDPAATAAAIDAAGWLHTSAPPTSTGRTAARSAWSRYLLRTRHPGTGSAPTPSP